MTKAEMRARMAEHTADLSRSLVAELIHASRDMSATADDDGARLDALECARLDWLESETVCAVLTELYGAICREPERARELVSGTHAVWREVAAGRHRALKAVRGEAVCAGCGVSSHHDDLVEQSGVSRGVYCEACIEQSLGEVAF